VEDPEAGDRAQRTSEPGARKALICRGGRVRGRRGRGWRTSRALVEGTESP
jgi:hypothetical protein